MADGLAPVKRLNADTVGEFNANRFLTQISERTSQDVANEVRGNLNNPNSIVNRTLAENTRKLDTLIGKVDIIADDTKYIRRVVRKIEKGGLGAGSTGGSFLGDAFNWVVGGAAAKAALKALRFLGPGGGTVSAAFLAYEIARMAARKAGVTDKEMDDKMSYLVTGKQNQTTIKTAIGNATRRYLGKHGLIRATPKIPIRIRDVNNHRLAIQRAMLNDARGAMNALGDSARTALTGTEFKYLGTYIIMAGVAARAIYRSVWEIDIERDPIKDATRASQIVDEVLAVLDAIPKDQNTNKTTQTRKPRPAADNQTRAAQTAQQTQQSTLPTAAVAPVIASTATTATGTASGTTAATAAPKTAQASTNPGTPGQMAPPTSRAPESRASEPIKPDDLSKPMSREQAQRSAGLLPHSQTGPSTVAPTPPEHHPVPVPVPTPQQLDPGVGVPGAVPSAQQPSAVHGGPDQTFGTPSSVKPVDTGPAAESLQPAPKETVKGEDKEASAVNFFMGKGWSRAQASAIVGNLKTESKLNPKAHNAGEDARGVAQWRFDRITAIENKFGKPLLEMSRQEQLEAVHWELTEGGKKKVGQRLKTIDNVDEATAYVDRRFEASSGGARDERIANARSLYSRETIATQQTDAGKSLEEIQSGAGTDVVKMTNQGATRNHRIRQDLHDKINESVQRVYGPGYRAEVYSGGQDQEGPNRTGTHRHDDLGEGGLAGDTYVVGPDGNRVRGADLAKLGQYWTAKGYGGVGLEMHGGGIHLDVHTDRARHWNYAKEGGSYSKEQAKIMQRGLGGELPDKLYDLKADEKKNNAEVKADVKPLKPEQKDLAPTETSKPLELTLHKFKRGEEPEDDPLTKAPATPAEGLAAINATRTAGPDDKLSKPSHEFRVTPGYLTRKALEHGKGGEDGFNPVDSIPESQKRKVNMDPKTKAFTANQEELAAIKKKAGSMFDMGFSVTPMAKGGQFDTSGPTLVPSQQGPVLMGERGTEKVTVTPKEKLPPPHRLAPLPQQSPVGETHPEPTRAQDGTPLQSRDIGRPHTSAAPTRSQHPRPPMSYLLANDLRNHKGFVGNVADYGLSGLTNLTPDQR